MSTIVAKCRLGSTMADTKRQNASTMRKSVPLSKDKRKSSMENVVDSITGMLFQDTEVGNATDFELTAATTSTDDSQDDIGISYSTSGCDSSIYLPSPPRIAKPHHASTVSPAFSPIHRPVPVSPSSTRTDDSYFDSSDILESFASVTSGSALSMTDSSFVESAIESVGGSEVDSAPQSSEMSGDLAVRSTPMARMRSDAVAQAAKQEQDVVDSPPRESKIDPEKKMADKHRKWRRQIKEAKRLKDEEKRRSRNARESSNFCVSTSNLIMSGKNEPARFFERFTPLRCGNIDDALSFDFSDDFSQASSDSEAISVTSPTTIGKLQTNRCSQIPSPDLDSDAKEVVAAADEESENNNSLESATSTNSHLNVQDVNFIKAFIREASHEGYRLIWHMPSSDQTDFDTQIDVVAFLEHGFLQEDGSFAGPRLAWYSDSGDALGAIDLLDIRSLTKASPLQLNDYPFAIPGNSMILNLQNSSSQLVLEAVSPSSARRFIHGLRWVVARLTFNLIVGNKDVCCELLELRDSSQVYRSADMNKAMNDVTKQLIDKAMYSSPQRLV